MKPLFTLCILFFTLFSSAQNSTLFNQGTTAYNEGSYEQAAEYYLKILEGGEHSASLYFNLGNVYYKLSKAGPSIYYYEKALLLDPDNSDIKNNLSYAQKIALDAIETIPKTQVSRLYNAAVGSFTFDQWSYLAILFVVLFVFSYVAYYFFRFSNRKRIAFIISMVSIFLAIIALAFAFLQYTDFIKEQPAIIFDEEVIVKSEPNFRSEEVFKLHEGAKVNILETLKDWKQIQLADGKKGWITSESLKLLKDF